MIAALEQTQTDRMRELILHSRDGSPIALEAVRAAVRKQLLQAPPGLLLAVAEHLLELREEEEEQETTAVCAEVCAV